MDAWLAPLLPDVDAALTWLAEQGVSDLCTDSRQLGAGDPRAFIAWPGAAHDARAHVASALQLGARACLVEAKGVREFHWAPAPIAAMLGLKSHLGQLADRFFGQPSQQLDVLAVTGTNGKTTISWWTAQLLSQLGQPCGVIGTLGVGDFRSAAHASLSATGLTTPDPVTLHRSLKGFVQSGLQAAAIEASSIGVAEHRLDGIRVRVAQFSNFTQDHLDYHGDMDSYWACKRRLFEWPQLQAAVINVGDDKGVELVELAHQRGLDVWATRVGGRARLSLQNCVWTPDGVQAELVEWDASMAVELARQPLSAPIFGAFNLDNLLAALGAARALGHDLSDCAAACAKLQAVPGRMQAVALEPAHTAGLPRVVVDYAHTPDALQQVLLALRPVAQARGGKLWCVFGCGGDRDPIKRPAMGAQADRLADRVVITSDNPRQEAPAFILSQILAGVTGRQCVDVIEDRAQAIAYAIDAAAAEDLVLLAGKGHERVQIFADHTIAFDDVEHARLALLARARPSQTVGQGASA